MLVLEIDKDPRNALFYKERAELKERLFLYDDAISDINKAIKIAPENKGLKRFKEELQFGKERMAERKAQGNKFPGLKKRYRLPPDLMLFDEDFESVTIEKTG